MDADILTPKQRRVIAALAAAKSAAAACKIGGISEDTLARWRQLPAFRQALDRAAGERLDELARELGQLSRGAIAAYVAGLAESAPLPVRLRAADAVVKHLLAIRAEAQLEQRLAALEADVALTQAQQQELINSGLAAGTVRRIDYRLGLHDEPV